MREDRHADVDSRTVEGRHVDRLRTDFVHRRAIGLVAERRHRIAVQVDAIDAVRAGARVTELGALEVYEGCGGELRPVDQEEVGHPPCHGAFSQDDEAVVLAGRRGRAGTRDDGDVGLAARRDDDEAWNVDRGSCRRGLRRDLDLPGPGAVPRVGEADGFSSPLEELHAQFVFEVADLPAQRRLRDMQPFGGARDILFLSGGDEIAQMAKFHPATVAHTKSMSEPRNKALVGFSGSAVFFVSKS